MSMDFWATKDRYELETEETERLIHPAPKVKPPRTDLRRERTETDRDPDIDDDPDIARDKDLSLNYKNIGGSLVERVIGRFLYGTDLTALRVAARFVQADLDRSDYVSVVNKETGEPTSIKKETLESEEGKKKYVVKKDEEKGPAEDDAAKVRELAEKNPKLKGVLDTLADPKHKEHTTLTSLSELDVKKILPGVELPAGVKTIGDLQAIAQAKPAAPPKKEKKAPPPKQEAAPKQEAPSAAAPEAPKQDAAPKKEEAAPAQEGKKEAPAPSEPTKEEAPKTEKPGEPAKPTSSPQEPEDDEPVRPKEPKRDKPSKQEEQRAEAALEETLPQEFVEQIGDMRLHPDQVNTLLSAYKSAMNVDVPDDEVLTSAGYEMDPEKIDLPSHVYVNGKKTAFEELPPEQQSAAYDRHKMFVLATSMAAKRRLESKFAFSGLPSGPAKIIAETVLKSKGKPLSDETVQNFFSTSLATAFASHPLKDDEVKELLDLTKDHPAAKKLITAYVQASSYAEAREKYLSSSAHGPERITEFDDPAKIAKKLQQASDFLKAKTKNLPLDTVVVDPAMAFRNRVIDRMSYLAPERVPYIRGYLQDYEMEDYENRKAQTEKLTKQFDKAVAQEKKNREKELEKAGYDEHSPYRQMADRDADLEARLAEKGIVRPKTPAQPPGYDTWKDRKDVEESAKRSFNWLQNIFRSRRTKKEQSKELEEGAIRRRMEEDRLAGGEREGAPAKTAALTVEERLLLRSLIPSVRQRVAFRAAAGLLGPSYSSYPGCWTMGQSSPGVRTAVYWGQEPYEGTAPYPGWSQLHARDFGPADFDKLLASAREWLKLPVLGREIKGLYPDTQVRAALDLAIRDTDNGKYSVGLYPTVYNELLARLSSRPGPYELLTGKPDDVPVAGVKSAGKSTYGATTERGSTTMKASAQVRLFASRAAAANQDPELAFDMMTFADHLAAEEAQSGQQQAGQEQAPAQQAEAQKQAAIHVAATQMTKFNAVKALVVKQAAAHPTLREVFLPILQALKG